MTSYDSVISVDGIHSTLGPGPLVVPTNTLDGGAMTTGDSGVIAGTASTMFTPTPTTGGDVAAATSPTTTEGGSSSSSGSTSGVVALGYSDKISAMCIAGLLVVLVWM